MRTIVVPGTAQVKPLSGVQLLTTVLMPVLLVLVHVEVASEMPFAKVVTRAESPLTVPVYVIPAAAGAVLVIESTFPDCPI